MNPALAVILTGGSLTIGVYFAAVLDGFFAARVAGSSGNTGQLLLDPIRNVALIASQGRTVTERPDRGAWALAPALLTALAAVAFTAVPLSPELAIADIPVGIVLFGAAIVQVMVAVFLHGWSPNSLLSMIGGYRFAALALSMGIPFSLVLITTAIPAESLSVGVIIESQERLWNVLRQPLGLPIYLLTALGFAFWGPFGHPDATDLAGGTQGETSGIALLTWRAARAAILVSAAAMGSAAFLAGPLGPWIPDWAWSSLKTVLLLGVMIWAGHRMARPRMENVVKLGWLLLLPLALVDVFVSGALALWIG